ncbi:uncharacterized protein LOC111057127 isoform X1 [Nilaparvata lugens]|uniref:uncharacterized protein LOC111057127 isoform X1 n=1 Tax=Nilaparvata lugens TaxID=108931 RepID=UPI00193E4E54|nr:uncharacterized protein LOC111057127 isoform X1 [Nilaparvata lugens]
MSSLTRKTTSSKKKRNRSSSQENKARSFESDIHKLRQMNLNSFSETQIDLQKRHRMTKFLSLPNISLAERSLIETDDFLPVPNNSRTPRLGIWKFISKKSISKIRQSSANEARRIIASLLEEKKLDSENISLTSTLILTVLIWAFKKGFNDFKASTLAYCFMSTHEYFLDSLWRNQIEVYSFFKEILIRHTIEDSPLSNHVFTIYECKDCLLYFCDTYLQVLPLLRCRLMPNMRIKLSWQDKKGVNNGQNASTTK